MNTDDVVSLNREMKVHFKKGEISNCKIFHNQFYYFKPIIISDPCTNKNRDFPNGTILTQSGVESLKQCKYLCQNSDNCIAFVFLTGTNVCQLKGHGHMKLVKSDWASRNGAIAVDMKCGKEEETSDPAFVKGVRGSHGASFKNLSYVC